MATVVESRVEFTYDEAVSFVKHDTQNTQWPGVDFTINEADRWIWLEVKNWEPSDLSPSRRGGQRWSFISKMRSKTWFKNTLRSKFLGTTAFLTHTGAFVSKRVLYVALLESPKMSPEFLFHATNRLQQQVWRSGPWIHTIDAAVMDVAEWNTRFPDYPAQRV